jgi:hypothetical protein
MQIWKQDKVSNSKTRLGEVRRASSNTRHPAQDIDFDVGAGVLVSTAHGV